jgi:molecular chaperone GrpE
LSDNGLEEIKAIGENFDHSLHDASSYETVVDKSMDNKVIAVINKGYKLNGKILIPAKVKVGEFKVN